MADDNVPAISSDSPGTPPLTDASSAHETGIQEGSVSSPAPSSTNIQADAPATTQEQSIPLPPLKPRRRSITLERLNREIRVLDGAIVGLVLVLAFFLASFAIQNHDIWMHLATGRLIAEGSYTFGDNPFSNPKTVYWANHSWIFDVVLYELASLGGGIDAPAGQAILVIFKAIVVLALAWVLLRMRRPQQSLWIPALCVGLALLVLSPRLILHPICLSLLFLGLTLYLLNKRPGDLVTSNQAARPASGLRAAIRERPIWLLPVLFVLWVNVDGWFILGPLTVLLFLIGELVQKLFAPGGSEPHLRRPGRARNLAAVFVVGLLACLASPFHYHAFTLPTELSYLVVSIADKLNVADSLPGQVTDAGRALHMLVERTGGAIPAPSSPLSTVYFRPGPETGLSAAGIAYFLLLVVSAASFVVLLGRWSWGRLIVWLAFALLGLAQVRSIPFFAVVAGPIAALNFQDFSARNLGVNPRLDGSWVALSIFGRLGTIVGMLALAVLSWPGYLHANPDDPAYTHRAAWHAEPDAYLQRTAQQLRDVRGWAELRNGFNFSPNFAYYCAWYCPGEKTYFDYRFGLFRDRIEDFLRIRASLFFLEIDAPQKNPSWKPIFREHQIDHLILANSPIRLAKGALLRCWLDAKQFPQPDVGEESAIFAWLDPKQPERASPFGKRSADLNALAFGRNTLDRAPDRAPSVEPEKSGFIARFAIPPQGDPWDAAQATLLISYHSAPSLAFDAYLRVSGIAPWLAVAASGESGTPLVRAPISMLAFPDFLMKHFHRAQVIANKFGSKAAPVLAVRAARRAVAARPRDAESYLALAEAYLVLWDQEGRWSELALGETYGFLGREDGPPGQARAPGPEYVSKIKRDFAPRTFRQLTEGLRQTVREAQVIAALKRAAVLSPSSVEAHQKLFEIYRYLHCLDAALSHLEMVVKNTRARPVVRRAAEKAEEFEKREKIYNDELKRLDAQLKALDAEVKERRKDYRLNAANKSVSRKLRLAILDDYPRGQQRDPLGRGLILEADKVLKNAKSRELDLFTVYYRLKLSLLLGDMNDLRSSLKEIEELIDKYKRGMKAQPRLAEAKAHFEVLEKFFRFFLEAVDGDYAAADESLAGLEKISAPKKQVLDQGGIYILQLVLYYNFLKNQPLVLYPIRYDLAQSTQRGVQRVAGEMTRAADIRLLRGLMALEHGDTRKSATEFRAVVSLTHDLVWPEAHYDDRRIAEEYLKLLERK